MTLISFKSVLNRYRIVINNTQDPANILQCGIKRLQRVVFLATPPSVTSQQVFSISHQTGRMDPAELTWVGNVLSDKQGRKWLTVAETWC